MVEATCPSCKKKLYGYKWTKTKTGKNWLMNTDGTWHSCERVERKDKKNKYPNMFEKWIYKPVYYSCGCCGENLKAMHSERILDFYETPVKEIIGWWCESCNMYPQVSHRRSDELGNGAKDPNVGALYKSNRDEIIDDLKSGKLEVMSDKIERVGDHQSGEKPPNWMCMKEDGSMMNGWKLTGKLTEWFKSGGKEILQELEKRTEYVKLEKPLYNDSEADTH